MHGLAVRLVTCTAHGVPTLCTSCHDCCLVVGLCTSCDLSTLPPQHRLLSRLAVSFLGTIVVYWSQSQAAELVGLLSPPCACPDAADNMQRWQSIICPRPASLRGAPTHASLIMRSCR